MNAMGIVAAARAIAPTGGGVTPYMFQAISDNGSGPYGLYTDVACTTPATVSGDLIAAWKDERPGKTGVLIQSNPAKRFVLDFVGGVAAIFGDGTRFFEEWVTPAGVTSFVTGHNIRVVENGYHNVYDRVQEPGKIRPEMWIDPSGRVELNGFSGSPIVSSPITDGAPRRVIARSSNTGGALWINGASVGTNAVPMIIDAPIVQFNRDQLNCFKGHVFSVVFDSVVPDSTYIASLDSELSIA